jgi:hypothetical protein
VIRVVFDPLSLVNATQSAWWTKWREWAHKETSTVVERFEEWLELEQQNGRPFQAKFNAEVWKALKDWYLESVFYEKCAYCERRIMGYYGDAEHYRPKGAVKQPKEGGGLERVTCELPDPRHPGQVMTVPHPGYFWLAYDWRNLLPACVYCNSGYGKNDRFDAKRYAVMVMLKQSEVDGLPVYERPLRSKKWPSYYYPSPIALDTIEEPRLLNPLNAVGKIDPRQHIRFGIKGMVAAVDGSDRGESTIEILRLREDKLTRARQEAQEAFRDKYYDAMRRFDPQAPQNAAATTLLDEYSHGRYPFSAAALDYREILVRAQP